MPLNALYVGIRTPGTTSQLRASALQELLPDAAWTLIDTDDVFQRAPRWARSLWFRMRSGPAVKEVNQFVSERTAGMQFGLAWIDKGVVLWPETIRRIREQSVRLIYYTPDASFLANGSRFFRATLPLYDLVATTKSFELPMFQRQVLAEKVVLVTQSFDSHLHFPRCAFEAKRPEAVLIGLNEPSRERCVDELLDAGIAARVGGQRWDAFLKRHCGHPRLTYEGPAVFGVPYAEVLSRACIGLGLLTRKFPELHTTRTFEIPACGTALATERNAETVRFFDEDEAIFFRDDRDLAERIQDLMSNPEKLKALSAAGRRRVVAGEFSNLKVLRRVLLQAGLNPVADSPSMCDSD